MDVVWALCVLQRARETELRAVLRPDLHTQFLGERRAVPSSPLLRDAEPAQPPELPGHWLLLRPLPGGGPQTPSC